MPVFIKAIHVDRRRLKAAIRTLHAASEASFLKVIPSDDFADSILEKLQQESPKGRWSSPWKRWLRSGIAETGSKWAGVAAIRFGEGWKVSRKNKGADLGFAIEHELENLGETGRAKFYSILRGSRSSTWAVRNSFRFKLDAKKWVSFRVGDRVIHGATPAHDVIGTIKEFVTGRLARQFRDRIYAWMNTGLSGA